MGLQSNLWLRSAFCMQLLCLTSVEGNIWVGISHHWYLSPIWDTLPHPTTKNKWMVCALICGQSKHTSNISRFPQYHQRLVVDWFVHWPSYIFSPKNWRPQIHRWKPPCFSQFSVADVIGAAPLDLGDPTEGTKEEFSKVALSTSPRRFSGEGGISGDQSGMDNKSIVVSINGFYRDKPWNKGILRDCTGENGYELLTIKGGYPKWMVYFMENPQMDANWG